MIGDQLTAPLRAMISLKKVDIFECERKTEFIFSLTQHALYVEKLKNKLSLYARLLSTAAREVQGQGNNCKIEVGEKKAVPNFEGESNTVNIPND